MSQHRGKLLLQPGPLFPGHAVAEHHGEFVQCQPQAERRLTGAQTPAGPPAAEQQVFLLPEGAQGGRRCGGSAPGQYKIHGCRGKQGQQQSVCKTKQKQVLRIIKLPLL